VLGNQLRARTQNHLLAPCLQLFSQGLIVYNRNVVNVILVEARDES